MLPQVHERLCLLLALLMELVHQERVVHVAKDGAVHVEGVPGVDLVVVNVSLGSELKCIMAR